jgi:hypothetical protein
MGNLIILDVGLGLVFTYALLALICSSLNESIATFINLRGKMLKDAIGGLVSGIGSEAFYNHALIAGLMKNPRRFPSYVSSKIFRIVLMEKLVNVSNIAPGAPSVSVLKTSQDFKAMVDKLPSDGAYAPLKQSLHALIDSETLSIEKIFKNIENWYDTTMDRVTGWYRRASQYISLAIALVLAVYLNADSIAMIKSLSSNAVLRSSVAAMAQEYAKAIATAANTSLPPQAADSTKSGNQVAAMRAPADAAWYKDLESAGIDLQWHSPPNGALQWVRKIFGLLITVVAVSLGAPFWFDLLNKVVQLRGTGKAM